MVKKLLCNNYRFCLENKLKILRNEIWYWYRLNVRTNNLKLIESLLVLDTLEFYWSVLDGDVVLVVQEQ